MSIEVASTPLTKWLRSKTEAAQKAKASSKPALEAEILIDKDRELIVLHEGLLVVMQTTLEMAHTDEP